MRFQIITIFPEFFQSPLRHGLLEKAITKQIIAIDIINLREFASPPHYRTDDYAYGGGPGMVMTPGPLAEALRLAKNRSPESKVYALSPGGRPLTDSLARDVAKRERGLILVCGRYEGIDQRIIDHYCDGELSVGDYVLTGGEPAALVVIDAISRMLPGVVGDPQSVQRDSFTAALAPPQYTRPPEFEGHPVPDVLLSGNHEKIELWRKQAARDRTLDKRSDLAPDLARKRMWLVYISHAEETANREEWLHIYQLVSILGLAGVAFGSGDTAIRKAIRNTINALREHAQSLQASEALPPFLVKPSLNSALQGIEQQEQATPIPIAPTTDKGAGSSWRGAPTSLAEHPAALIFGEIRSSERNTLSIETLVLDEETAALPRTVQIPILVDLLLNG